MMRRLLVLTAVVVSSIVACQQDEAQGPSIEELRVQDSALAHEVMTAWGDSFRITVDEPKYDEPAPKPSVVAKAPVVAPQPPAAPLIAAPLPLPPPKKTAPKPAVVVKRESKPEEAPSRARTIPNGATLSLVTNERICSSRIGETFRATLLSPVSTSSGTIPSGARATAEITSSDRWGAGIGVRVRAIHSDGATYPVSSRVTYILPENSDDGACIPRRAHIDTEVRG